MIYWIEHAPNPWVRAAAIIITGALAYYYGDNSAVPPQSYWIGPWGYCTTDGEILYE